ncbi:MAG: hypothetical protein AB8B72_12625 [Crocinitomicaceae bacterium]
MKKLILFFTAIALVLVGCEKEPIQQGEIVYEITYPYSELNGIMDVMLPKKMTAVFKGDKMIASIEKSKVFRTDIVSEGSIQEIKMRLDFGSENIEAVLTPEDLSTLQNNQPSYEVSSLVKTDTIAGLEANFYTATSKNESVGEFACAFSNNLSLKSSEWFSSYTGTEGIPLMYVMERYGIIMHLRAKSFRSREVKDSEFNAAQNFKNVSYKKYEKKVNELFELIIEE